MSGEHHTLASFEVLATKWAPDIEATARAEHMFPHEVVEMVASVVLDGAGKEWDGPL